MATIKYGALELIPAPELGINLESKFFGADIRYSRSKVYTLRGTILSNQTSGVSGIYTQQQQIVTGFQNDYLGFDVNGTIVGYPQVRAITFDNGTLVQKNVYTIELEFLESGNPFQLTGTNYNLSSISGLLHNVESLSETLDYNTDFKTYGYTHSIDVNYRTGVNINPQLNAKLIASGLINNKSAFPFVISGGPFGVKRYEEREDVFNGSYGVTEVFDGTTGNLPYEHYYILSLQLQANGITSVSQQGTIKGYDPSKYNSAKSGYGIIRDEIYQNCSGFYLQNCSGTLNETYLTDTRTDDINNGIIEYSRGFTDETGVSNVRWQYTHQITLEGNLITASEQGNIIGLGHISERFTQASGFYNTIRPNIKTRVLNHVTGFGLTGIFFENFREQGFNKFNGSINYNYGYGNNPGLGAGSGISSFTVTVSDDLPIHNKVGFNVVNFAVVNQSLESTSQGTRTVSVNTQAFRDTNRQTVLQFATNKTNQYRPLDANMTDPFINSISLNYNPVENNLQSSVGYTYGGQKLYDDTRI